MFQPNGIVTLTSDFGTVDGYVGAMKGSVLSVTRDLQLVDIAHDIPAWNIRRGAFCLRSAIPYFPPGAVHVAVVDPGVGTPQQSLLAIIKGHAIVAPDNGLISLLLDWDKDAPVFLLDFSSINKEERFKTFHGRDLYGPAAALLASGKLKVPGTLQPADPPKRFPCGFSTQRDTITGTTLCSDRFGNIISSIPWAEIPDPKRYRVRAGSVVIDKTVRAYGEAVPGTLVALEGSLGLMEISLIEGNASERLKLAPGSSLLVEPRGVGV